jgi:hypothetical protein
VNSWLTGRRLVSLPFSDHCEPLIGSIEQFHHLLAGIRQETSRNNSKYIEFRPLTLSLGGKSSLEKSESFCFHKLDLRPSLTELFGRFHKKCVQKKIERAEREDLQYEVGSSAVLLRKFYDLQVITRHRQQLVPQPFAWFYSLGACMGDKFKIRVVSKNDRPIAGILTLQFRQTMVCKYSCSDKLLSNLGGIQLLFWKAIQDAKNEGLLDFDLGRSDPGNEGLIRFKDRLGAVRSTVTYWRYPAVSSAQTPGTWKIGVAKRIFSRLPEAWLAATGGLLYRHIG